jgi:ATP-binding cassette subfamily B protein
MSSFHLIKPYFKRHWQRIVTGLACLVAVDVMQLSIPRVVKRAVDALTLYTADLSLLIRYAAIIIALAAAIGCFRYLWRRCLIGLSQIIEEALRNRLFSHLQTLSAPFFDQTRTGDLMARATNDIKNIRMATGMGLVALTDALVLGSAAIGFMLYINVSLTLYVLIPMPMIVLTTRLFGRKMHRRYQSMQAGFSELTEAIRERFAGIHMIKAYNQEQTAQQQVAVISRDYIDRNLRLVRITRTFFPMMLLFSNLSVAIVLFLGGRKTITATITPGDFVAFISYLGLLTWPMMALGWLTNLIQRGKASLDRINEILATTSELPVADPPRSPSPFKGEIRLERVSFAYPDPEAATRTKMVLKEIDLTIPAGTTCGLVGPPGSGKTTLLQLMARVYDVDRGAVCIDGVDIRHIDPDRLRGWLALVPQESFLFSGTVRENIIFAPSAQAGTDLSGVLAAARLDREVQLFTNGIDTPVGERGVILSGGQKQRVALARALQATPSILLLDDPVSQVDAQTADHIVAHLKGLGPRVTQIIVSHRMSAVRHAHQIVVLENGCIVEQGPHETLMAAGGYYAHMVKLQDLEGSPHAS